MEAVIPALAVQLSYPLAFLAGVVSFLSPCVFPLLPAYLAYLGGRVGRADLVSAGDAGAVATDGAPLIRNGIAFVLGFSAIFVLFFYIFTALDVSLLRSHRHAVNVVSGALVIVLALEVLGVLRLGVLMRERRMALSTDRAGAIGAFILGVTFAAGWTPCIGPQLTAILTVASQHEFGGLPLMLVYCAGLGLPFLAAAVLADRLQGVLRAVNRRLGIINLVAGALLLLFGLFLLSDQITLLSRFGTGSPLDL